METKKFSLKLLGIKNGISLYLEPESNLVIRDNSNRGITVGTWENGTIIALSETQKALALKIGLAFKRDFSYHGRLD